MKRESVDIGNILRSRRIERKTSLETASFDTRIMQKYLEAMENEQFEKIPGEVVVKGFLKNYSEYLGIDAKPLIAEYLRRIKKTHPMPTHNNSDNKSKTLRFNHFSKLISYALCALIFITVIFAMIFNASKARKVNHNVLQTEEKQLIVKAEILEPTWLFVLSDDKHVWSGVLRQGKTKHWSANKKIRIKIGNAAGIRITKNNKILYHPGERGKVVQVEFLK